MVGGFINAAHFNGGVTTLSGIAEAGDTVTVSDGTHVTPATVSADGAWTAAISGLFNGQSYSYTATATDAAGNTATSAPFAFTVKTSTFESAITDAAVTGGYLNGAHFNGGSTTLSGKAEAGDTVTVSDGTHATVATVASDGSWTAVISGLGNGQRYSYTATALDAAGNTATSQPFAFTVKTSTSESAITDAAVIGGFINAAHFNAGTTTLSGKAEAGDTVIVSDGTHVTAATVATDGSWTAAISGLLNGQTYSYTATATDLAGNTATSAPFGFKVDTQPPSPTISTAGGEAIYPAVIISGTGEAGTLVQLYDGLTKIGAPVAVSGNGSWTETVTLVGTGSHAISALDTDAAGNTGKSASIVFSLDNQIVGNTNQSIISGTSANDHITVVPNNLIVNAGGGNDTITLTSGPSTQVHIVDGGAGTNTLDLSQISSAVTVDLKLGVASGSQVGTVLLSSIQNVVAGGGAEAIVGSSGANVFQAGSGMDRITGGGGADTFVFRPGFGNTTVTDFKVSGASHGTIEIDHSIFATWAALDAALADSKQGAVITVNAAESITLNGVTKAQLEANHLADFHFI
ncbi:MAG: hypothetical protein EKK41_13465 [Hyphomicrobiales bacterium]|nr:MAG: hypothetical protein EKK41_13465 [Hyphomicrobiales bacterium]